MENILYYFWIICGISLAIAALTGTIKVTWGKTTQPPPISQANPIDSQYLKELIEAQRRSQMVYRQVWAENEKRITTDNGGEWPCGFDYKDVTISKLDAFSLDLLDENVNECAAIFFIRKGVKAHYDEIRQQSGTTTDHLKHKEQ